MGCVWNILSPADSKSQRLPISAQKAGRTTFVVSFSWLPGQWKNYQENSFLAPSPVELCMGCVWNILSPADSKSQRLPISAQKAGRTTFVVSFIWLPGQCKNYQQNSFLAPSPVELCMGCVWNILSPADSKSQRFPISAQKAGRTTFVVSFSWLPGQCKNNQQNSFLAPSPVELCMGCVWNILSPADSKSQRLPISAQKAGRTTFVVSFIWLPGQCKNYQQNSFLAPSPVELCMGCVWNILSPADSKSQRFPISAQKAGRTTFVVSFIWLPGQCKNYQQNSFLAPSPVELCMGCVWNILSPADSKSQRFPISAQKAGRTTFVVSFSWLPGQCKNYQQNSFLAPSPVELCMGCVWNILSPADSKSQRFPISAQKAGRTTFVVSFSWLPGQWKNYQQNSFLAPSPVELCMGCVWNILSPADSKSQRFPISAQKAGRTTFVVSFIWLPGQCKNYQQNSFLAPSPVELCMGCVWNILSPADSKSQRFPISAQKAGRTTFVVSFSWLPGQWKNYQQNSFLAPSPVELCMGCVWNILSPADSKSQRFPISARKQVEPLLWCLSAGYRGSVRTTKSQRLEHFVPSQPSPSR